MSSSTLDLLESATVIKQGAEAKIYKVILHTTNETSLGTPVVIKYRFPKQYRHPSLDSSLTRARVAGEARALFKCLKSGVNVPGIRMVDAACGVLGIEWIEGESIRVLLGSNDDSDLDEEESEDTYNTSEYQSLLINLSSTDLMNMIGEQIAKMHAADIIHGDLTTSNMMLRRGRARYANPDETQPSVEVVLIDFGLSYFSSLAEDKAVDLYVLERAFSSTHPESEPLFKSVLQAYQETSGSHWKAVGKKLDEVRLRGRKRSMVG